MPRSVYKITGPITSITPHCLGDPAEDSACWLFGGVGYTHSAGTEAYAERTEGYSVERVMLDDAEYAAYQARCVRQRSQDHIGLGARPAFGPT